MPGFSWRLPKPPLRSSAGLAVALATATVVTGGTAVGLATASGAMHLAKALVLFVPAAVIVLASAGAHHPHARFGAANQVTLLRLVLIAVTAGFVGGPGGPRVAWLVVAIVAIVGALDGLDGWLARRTGLASPFGARFDMECDALFVLVLSVVVWQHDRAGAWVLLCGGMRYIFVAAGWVLPWLAGPLRSTRRGKTVAVGQLVGLGTALLPVLPVGTSSAVAATTLLALAWSFALDIGWLSRQSSRAGAPSQG